MKDFGFLSKKIYLPIVRGWLLFLALAFAAASFSWGWRVRAGFRSGTV